MNSLQWRQATRKRRIKDLLLQVHHLLLLIERARRRGCEQKYINNVTSVIFVTFNAVNMDKQYNLKVT